MSSEGTLQTAQEQLEAQKRIGIEENENIKKAMQERENQYKAKENDMAQKLQDLLIHNEKVKDDCLKKVLVYKDKYTDYKNKVRSANQQIGVLKQRVARYEIERGEMEQAYMQDANNDESNDEEE